MPYVQRPMKPDELELLRQMAVRQKRESRVSANAYAIQMGMPAKRCMYILSKWADKGLWEYGVSLRGGWLTEKGIAFAETPP